MTRGLLPAWGEAEPEIGGTIADALNSVYRRAQFLERVLGFLKTLGDLAPPCAVVPLLEARAELASEASDLRRTLLPAAAPEIVDAMRKALDALDAQILNVPSDLRMWVDAPSQWRAGAYEETIRRSPIGSMRAVPSPSDILVGPDWGTVKEAADVLLHLGTLSWLVTVGPPGAVVAGIMYGGGIGDAIASWVGTQARDCAVGLKPVLQGVLSNAMRFEQRTKRAVYQQVLGAWMLTRTSASPTIMREAMRSLNPYALPSMPEVWDGGFDHLARNEKPQESGAWLIALLLGGFVGLSVAALTE